MTAERLLKHFERIADAPDAVRRLRRFVLDLAVRGKLVPQDANDEPASELLKRIAKEKERLVKTGMLKAERDPKAPSLPTEIFDLPQGWNWATLQSVCHSISDGDHQPPPKSETGVPFLVIGDVRNRKINYDAERRVPHAYFSGLDAIRKPRAGDLLYTLVGSFGIPVPVLSDQPFCIQRHIGILRPSELIDLKALAVFLESEFAFKQAEAAATGIAQKTVSLAGLRSMALPLPPLAEQHRIVAMVDELMGLCDRLESARAGREAVRDRLAAASLARLNAPDPETFQDDARFALDALPALTSRPDQIKALRQTILNLAVRGTLVPQDPNDEPASDLLERIHRERRHKRKFAQIHEGELDAPLPNLPTLWLWTTADQISADDDNAITDGPFGSQLKTDHYINAPGFRVIRLQNIGAGAFRNEHRSYIDQSRFERLSKHHVKAGDLVVAGLVDPTVRSCEVPADIGPALVKADCYRFAIHPELSSRYALHCLNSPVTQGFAAIHHHGMTLTRIGLGNFRHIPIPLPPLAEQHRIVAKVDALMKLCDQLEASLTATAATRRRLLDALLAEALAPADGRDREAVAAE